VNSLTRNLVRAATAACAVAVVIVAVRGNRRRKQVWLVEGRPQERETRANVLLPGAREEIYDLFRDLNRLAAALGGTVEVLTVDDTTFRWAHGVDGEPTVVVTVEITGDLPELLLSWETAEPPLPHEGTVRFTPVGDGDRTRVDVGLRYRWSTDLARQAGVPDDAVDRVLSGYLRDLQRSVSRRGAEG
jgi:uncharacterized membrane protein